MAVIFLFRLFFHPCGDIGDSVYNTDNAVTWSRLRGFMMIYDEKVPYMVHMEMVTFLQGLGSVPHTLKVSA